MCNPKLHIGRQQIPPLVQDYLNEVRCTSFCNHPCPITKNKKILQWHLTSNKIIVFSFHFKEEFKL
jgi:hypothetical protein